jgi:hypothetical protein
MTQIHTPGPWYQGQTTDTCMLIFAPEVGVIIDDTEAALDDIAFIVRACNAHDELVKALEKVRIFVNGDRSPADMSTATFIIDKALALARGKEQP